MMVKYIGRLAAPLVVSTLLLAAACGGDRDDNPLRSDSGLASDLALANAQGDTTLPQLSDVPLDSVAVTPPAPAATTPRTTAPRTTATRPAPTRPAPTTPTRTPSGNTVTTTPAGGTGTGATGGRIGVVSAGTSMTLASSSKVCTNTHKVGDRVTATLSESISGTNGASIPAGATVTMTATKLERSDNINDPIVMEFRVNSITFGGKTYALDARVADADIARVRDQPRDKDVQKVVGGAVIGAIAGRVLGGSTKATVGGAAAGAAAGAATAAATSNYAGCINAGSRIVVTLEGPVEIVVS